MHILTKKTNIQHQIANKSFNIFLVQNELELLENNFSKEVRTQKYSTNTVTLISTKKNSIRPVSQCGMTYILTKIVITESSPKF